MAIYHCSVKNIGRSGGSSAVASASYRAGEKLEDLETGKMHDYTSKQEVAFSEIILCKNAPLEYQDRATLWNEVQKVETQSNARLAREFELALPNELTLEQSKEVARTFGQSLADEGMCADVNIHWKDGNHHVHIMATTRPIKDNGEWGQKEKKAYALDENGQKIPMIDPATGEQKIGARGRKMWKRETVEANDWNKLEKVEEWRERWADVCNQHLEKDQHIDHRSYERQGVERIPTIHEGWQARDMEKNGEISERCEINRHIESANIQLEALNHELSLVARLREKIKAEFEKAKEQLKAKESEIRERLSRLRTSRRADEPAGRNADGNRPIQADNSRPAEPNREGKLRVTEREKEILTRSIELGTAERSAGRGKGEDFEARVSALGSAGQGRDLEDGVGRFAAQLLNVGAGEPNTETLVREARAGIDRASSIEEDSRTKRADRDATQERLNRAREQEIVKRQAPSYDRGRSR